MPRAQRPSNISTLEAFVAAVAHQTNNKKFIKERQENYTTNKLEKKHRHRHGQTMGRKKVACHMANGMEAQGTPRSNRQLRTENCPSPSPSPEIEILLPKGRESLRGNVSI